MIYDCSCSNTEVFIFWSLYITEILIVVIYNCRPIGFLGDDLKTAFYFIVIAWIRIFYKIKMQFCRLIVFYTALQCTKFQHLVKTRWYCTNLLRTEKKCIRWIARQLAFGSDTFSSNIFFLSFNVELFSYKLIKPSVTVTVLIIITYNFKNT